jgi:hypothetical protein
MNRGRRNTARERGLAQVGSQTVASERAGRRLRAGHGANGLLRTVSGRPLYRNCKGAVDHEGTREIPKLMQADYVLGYRQRQGPTRCELPPYGG